MLSAEQPNINFMVSSSVLIKAVVWIWLRIGLWKIRFTENFILIFEQLLKLMVPNIYIFFSSPPSPVIWQAHWHSDSFYMISWWQEQYWVEAVLSSGLLHCVVVVYQRFRGACCKSMGKKTRKEKIQGIKFKGIWTEKHKSRERENKELAGAGLVSWEGQCAGLVARLGQALLHRRLPTSFEGWMRGFHDQLEGRPSSLFMLLGCSVLSCPSLNNS
jgi:hypothetical protein